VEQKSNLILFSGSLQKWQKWARFSNSRSRSTCMARTFKIQ